MYEPTPDDKFSFGLWTITQKIGNDPFGKPTREPPKPPDVVRKFGESSVWGINFHDNDLVPQEASTREREELVGAFRAELEETGLVVSFASCNLFEDPMFRDGASVPRTRWRR